MGQYDFTYEFPTDFEKRVLQILQQKPFGIQMAIAFKKCSYEYEDLGLAYYAGVTGDTWNKNALDFTIEGPYDSISVLKNHEMELEDAISKALRSSISGLVTRKILFLFDDVDVLFPESNDDRLNADISAANDILADLIKIGEKVCTNATYSKESSENSINDYFRDTLSLMRYDEVKDQTRHGISLNGLDAGEIDILITKDGKEVAIFEGLKLDSVNTTYIDDHISKAIINYNSLGTATFVVAYVTSANFEKFWERYIAYLQSVRFPLHTKQVLAEKPYVSAAVRVAWMILSRDGFDFPVYFVAFNIS